MRKLILTAALVGLAAYFAGSTAFGDQQDLNQQWLSLLQQFQSAKPGDEQNAILSQMQQFKQANPTFTPGSQPGGSNPATATSTNSTAGAQPPTQAGNNLVSAPRLNPDGSVCLACGPDYKAFQGDTSGGASNGASAVPSGPPGATNGATNTNTATTTNTATPTSAAPGPPTDSSGAPDPASPEYANKWATVDQAGTPVTRDGDGNLRVQDQNGNWVPGQFNKDGMVEPIPQNPAPSDAATQAAKAIYNDEMDAMAPGSNDPESQNYGVHGQDGQSLFNDVHNEYNKMAPELSTPSPLMDANPDAANSQLQGLADQSQGLANEVQDPTLAAQLSDLSNRLNDLGLQTLVDPTLSVVGTPTSNTDYTQLLANARTAIAAGQLCLNNPATCAGGANTVNGILGRMRKPSATNSTITLPGTNGGGGGGGGGCDPMGNAGGLGGCMGNSAQAVSSKKQQAGNQPVPANQAQGGNAQGVGTNSPLNQQQQHNNLLPTASPSSAGATQIGGGYSIKLIAPGTVEVFKNGQYIGTGPITSPPGGVSIPANVVASAGGGNNGDSGPGNGGGSGSATRALNSSGASSPPPGIASAPAAASNTAQPSTAAIRVLNSSGASSPPPGTTSTSVAVGNASQPNNAVLQNKVQSNPSTTIKSTTPSPTPQPHVATVPQTQVHVPQAQVHVPQVQVRVPQVQVRVPQVLVRIPQVQPHVSDIRLKRDIATVGELPSGLHLYRYRYLWSDTVYVGVMAQEVMTVDPDAVIRGNDGYLRVDYGRLGLRLTTWERWMKRGAAATAANAQ
jgi:hypothetical protein